MNARVGCEVDACEEIAVQQCTNCGRALCRGHTVADYSHLPGGQRPYCTDCDAERRQVYRRVRAQGLRAIAGSAAGAVAGSAVGYLAGVVVTSASFTHTVTTDVGFIAGMSIGLVAALRLGPR